MSQATRTTSLVRDGGLYTENWDDLRAQGHRMLDDMIDNLASLRERPLWQAPTADARARYRAELPRGPAALADVHAQFMADCAPYGSGNRHPGFMGWVQGGGTGVGMLAEMLAGGLDANLGGQKIAYDLLLLWRFQKVRPPEEADP